MLACHVLHVVQSVSPPALVDASLFSPQLGPVGDLHVEGNAWKIHPKTASYSTGLFPRSPQVANLKLASVGIHASARIHDMVYVRAFQD